MNRWFTRLDERFRRVTSNGTFVPEIDALRFVAISSVVAFHLYSQLVLYYGVHTSGLAATLFHNGDRGVRLFFVISGFVLALPFASHWLHGSPHVELQRYFVRRLTRLEPPYIVNLIICAILLLLVKHATPSTLLPHLISSLLYSHNLFYGAASTINVVTWSLEVEVQFYLIMPLLALVFAIPIHWVRRGVLVVAIVLAVVLQTHGIHTERAHLTLVYYIQFFLAGLILADMYLLRKGDDKKWTWDLCSIVGWPIVFTLNDRFSQIVLPFVVIALCWAVFHGRLTNRLFRLPALTIIGGMCYSIYLFHYLVIALVTRALGYPRPPLLVVSVSIVSIAIISSGYFLLVERPCMDRNWPRKLAAALWQHRKKIATIPTGNEEFVTANSVSEN
jgi:peptidoglycan/LPS O-acetylase OafA/YrhL